MKAQVERLDSIYFDDEAYLMIPDQKIIIGDDGTEEGEHTIFWVHNVNGKLKGKVRHPEKSGILLLVTYCPDACAWEWI